MSVYVDSTLTNDTLAMELFVSGTEQANIIFDYNVINAGYIGSGNQGILAWDVTNLRDGDAGTTDSWTWGDFSATDTLNVNAETIKNAGGDGSTTYLDAIGFRITTDEPCGGGSPDNTTISPLPLTDTYDPTELQFVSANPTPDTIDTGTGTINWNDLGPLYAGGTTQVTVSFLVLEFDHSAAPPQPNRR